MRESGWKGIIIVVVIALSIWFWIFMEGIGERRYNDFIQKEYSGVIKEIVFRAGRAGCPDVLIDSNWVIFTIEEQKVFDKIQVNDSIVKIKGGNKIIIYRRDSLVDRQLRMIY